MPVAMASLTGSACLEDYRIQGLPPSAFYISDFVSETEEQVLLDKVGKQSRPVRGGPELTSQDPSSSKTSMEAALKKTPPNLAFGSYKEHSP